MDNLETLARSGDGIALLKALQMRIARQLDETDNARDVAALARRLESITILLNEQEGGAEPEAPVTVLDMIRAKHRREA